MIRPINKYNRSSFNIVLEIIQEHTFLCPSEYDKETILKCLQNRMAITGQLSSKKYISFLKSNLEEVHQLCDAIINTKNDVRFDLLHNSLFQNSFDGIIHYDITQQKIIETNQAARAVFGYSEEEFLSLNPIILIDESNQKDISATIDNMLNQLSNGDKFNYTHNHRRKSGKLFLANISLLPVTSNGRTNALIVVRDLSEIVDKELAIEESKASFQSIFKMNPLGISVADVDNKIVDANEAFSNLLGYDLDEIIGSHFSKFYANNYDEQNKEMVHKLFNNEIELFEVEKEYKRKDGKIIMCHIWVNILEKNNQKFFLTCVQDITEQYEKDQETQEREERYRALFNNSLEGIVVIDFNQSEAIDVNPRAIELFGSNKEELLKSSMPSQSPEYQPDGRHSGATIKKILDEFKATLKETSFEWVFKRTNTGELFYAIVTFSPIKLKGVNSAVMFVNDLTERKKAQKKINQQVQELGKKNKQLEHYINSNLELESFAYVASHDLKQPLRSIGSFAQLLKRRYIDQLDDNAKEYMDFIMNNVQSMDSLIKDLLSYSRVSTKELDVSEINLQDLLNDLLGIYTIPENKNVEIIQEDMPTKMMGNKTKLKQVFQNLISNAIKFSKKDLDAKIEITFSEEGDMYQFSVKDNGIGIEEEFKEKIFLVFQRLHTKVDYEGSGIGLAICKKIVEQHGGEIWVESEYGKDTEFFFTIKKGLEELR